MTPSPAQRLPHPSRPRLRLVSPPLSREDTFGVLGAPISLAPPAEVLRLLLAAPRQGRHARVHFLQAQALLAAAGDETLRSLLAGADLLLPDDDALVAFARLRGRRPQRCRAAATLAEVLEASRLREYRHFFLGMSPSLASGLVTRLRTRFPGVEITGTYLPPLENISWHDVDSVTRVINAAAPHFVWACLPSPEQDRWLGCLRPLLHAPVLIAAGPLAEEEETPPRGLYPRLRSRLAVAGSVASLLLASLRAALRPS